MRKRTSQISEQDGQYLIQVIVTERIEEEDSALNTLGLLFSRKNYEWVWKGDVHGSTRNKNRIKTLLYPHQKE